MRPHAGNCCRRVIAVRGHEVLRLGLWVTLGLMAGPGVSPADGLVGMSRHWRMNKPFQRGRRKKKKEEEGERSVIPSWKRSTQVVIASKTRPRREGKGNLERPCLSQLYCWFLDTNVGKRRGNWGGRDHAGDVSGCSSSKHPVPPMTGLPTTSREEGDLRRSTSPVRQAFLRKAIVVSKLIF